ncbi:cell division-specific peptidoglycan biosynthesis regulator FtsW [Quadrisphaera granulorum]|uniref:Probable peptidoglycan glycosyltransferase FtsW n=1 Tax=Quadrisphaera granulorum TaxID=317664 RepID=A0A316ATZ0_9ACTN|nr:putative lipid II flippase FtsW [Quadrisphaera granulorum]PWJ53677.1 cell division-specific peptidoglycan biosynthesis regulator FtsW [Quadrisphaera granulorum]SZE96721.1 cell division-specific peptidoglycan biosynthesis regulator FtsW [Quadrisphaera granulorum]
MATRTTATDGDTTIDLRDGVTPSLTTTPAPDRSAPRPAPRRPALTTRQHAAAWGDALLGGALPGRLARWDTPLLTYGVLQGVVVLLVGLGLVMVLSSSSVEALAKNRSPYAAGISQAQFAVLGLVAMFITARLPPRFWRRMALPVLVVAVVLEGLVLTPLGVDVGGNVNWVRFGSIQGQPSEFGKVALVLWCAAVLASKHKVLTDPLRWGLPLALGVLPIIGIVLAGKDLGTAMVMGLVVFAAVFAVGVPLRHLGLAALVGLVALAVLAGTGNRMSRISSFLEGNTDTRGTGYQATMGLYALASGGLTGVGLGGSRLKWSWLPEAHNDYIFAIIGEELGLVGTLVVLALFVVFGWCCARVVRRSKDLFVVVLVSGVLAWVLGQAAVNIGVVIGVLPVIGLPLPLISAGGSALLCTLIAVGLVLSCARYSPGAQAALSARPGLVRRSLAVVSRAGRR